jgi:hypothetical protein
MKGMFLRANQIDRSNKTLTNRMLRIENKCSQSDSELITLSKTYRALPDLGSKASKELSLLAMTTYC